MKNFFKHFTCRKYMELTSKQLDQELTLTEKISHNFHHIICTFCRRAKRQVELINKALGSDCGCEDVELNESQKQRVLNSLNSNSKE